MNTYKLAAEVLWETFLELSFVIIPQSYNLVSLTSFICYIFILNLI